MNDEGDPATWDGDKGEWAGVPQTPEGFPKPRGPVPAGMTWDYDKGEWSRCAPPPAPPVPPPGIDLNDPRVAEIRAMLARERAAAASDEAPAAPAPDDVEAPAAPAPDGSAERVAPWLAHGRNVLAARTATALREPAGRSRAFEEAVADRVAFHGSGVFIELRNGRAGASVPEAQTVVDMLAPDFRNLAVAEILGDAAPSASSPRDPSPDELAAMLQRFVLRGGNVNTLLAKAGVAPGQS